MEAIKRWSGVWVNRHLLVINPINTRAVIVRAIDWGQNISTGRVLNLSPKTLTDLDATTMRS